MRTEWMILMLLNASLVSLMSDIAFSLSIILFNSKQTRRIPLSVFQNAFSLLYNFLKLFHWHVLLFICTIYLCL